MLYRLYLWNAGVDKRDEISTEEVLAKGPESADVLPACCSCTGESQGCFHPSNDGVYCVI